ncbi:MAG: glycosyl hydrolase family protein [Candidatus Abyssobacteria bacterium SURF_5]|uniref:Glycosyl hydrolase family protein n=1 Tax=Abyssobacteria bacterium (strain SURF_5) TaxID=2093360 RepID=A0A3A4P0N0_ABYX5|nr:MAG: glycosyl hydrolase family protein [Candidatus Abyssubacteria bacterium SURF_5]
MWGTADAAHQVEGNNTNSDFWFLEHMPDTIFAEPSGDACDHYHRYRDDIQLMAQLGFNSYRFSIEWARIEPQPGHFSVAVLDHYRRMLAACWENKLFPCVTFQHFTAPLWFTSDGGWEDDKAADRFARYCERASRHLGDMIGMACTINEANLNGSLAARGTLPREGLKTRLEFMAEAARRCGSTVDRFGPYLFGKPFRINEVMLKSHIKARDAMKAASGKFPVGVTLSMADYQAVPGGEQQRDRALAEDYDPFLEAARKDDFIGVQTYSRTRFGPDGALGPEEGVEVLIMGYEFWPEALEPTIRYAYEKAKVPVYVTENGIGTTNDEQRIEYVRRALKGVVNCLQDKIDVRGYYYWSLMDNFEWLFGYGPQFGLIAVDRETQLRTIKPSATYLGRIARANEF